MRFISEKYIMGTSLEECRYVLLPGKSTWLNSLNSELHEKAFSYWKAFWTELMASFGERRTFSSDSFLRQDIVSCLLHENDIVALHFYSIFDIEKKTSLDHSQISP